MVMTITKMKLLNWLGRREHSPDRGDEYFGGSIVIVMIIAKMNTSEGA